MRSSGFPVPWLDLDHPCDPTDWRGVLARLEDNEHQGDLDELLDAVRHARTRLEPNWTDEHLSQHVAYASLILETAIEWRMPAVERWAAAWLVAAGGTHLRLRWSSRARDGRFHSDGRAPDVIVAVAGSAKRVVAGLASGQVDSWTSDGGVTPLLSLGDTPVRTVAVRGDGVVAGGDRNAFGYLGVRAAPPPLPRRRDKLTASAIGPGGVIALGNEVGVVLVWIPGSADWELVPDGPPSQVMAVAVAAGKSGVVVRAAWQDGAAAEHTVGSGRPWWRWAEPGPAVAVAAWDHTGTRLAVATGRAVHLAFPVATRLWTLDRPIRALAWSPSGHLASATEARIVRSTSPLGSRLAGPNELALDAITSDQLIRNIAFLGDRWIVSTRDEQFAQWSIEGAGSDDPTFEAGDRVTAVAVCADDRQRVLIGTERGWLREYDAEGAIRRASRPSLAEVTAIAWSTGAWIVATLRGTFRVAAADLAPIRLDRDGALCVAAQGTHFAYGRDRAVSSSTGSAVGVFPSRVRDVRVDADGSLAAVDETGLLRLRHGVADGDGEAGRKGGENEEHDLEPGARLLAVDTHRGALVQTPGQLAWTGPAPPYDSIPGRASAGALYDDDRVALADPGLAVVLAAPSPTPSVRTPARATLVATGPRRIIGASATHVGGYDVVEVVADAADGQVRLDIGSSGDELYVRFPGGSAILPVENLVTRWDGDSPTVGWLAEALFRIAGVGDGLWHAGLDAAVDQARGPDPHRPVRLTWQLDAGDVTAETVPWELLHRSTAPLGWFDDPPITSVRLVPRAARHRGVRPPPAGRPSMLVLRGTDDGMEKVDVAFDRFRRRTRRTNLRLVGRRPRAVRHPDELWDEPVAPVDILQIWAHCGLDAVRFDPNAAPVRHAKLAKAIAELLSPRLVVLVGCRSGALGRALVAAGADAVVAMRVAVDDHTVQPLVEDFTARVLRGEPVDLAFAAALLRYVHTGYPGAAAIPMLYLAADAEPVLFVGGSPQFSEEFR